VKRPSYTIKIKLDAHQLSGNKNDDHKPVIMDVELVPVTRDTECGFCFARLCEIEDPKALPCGHTHCKECIYVNYQNKEIECKVCK
jgi:hypothetical protein